MYTDMAAPKLTATASVAQSVERWPRDPGSYAGALHAGPYGPHGKTDFDT